MAYSLLRILSIWIFGTNVLNILSMIVLQFIHVIESVEPGSFEISNLINNSLLFIFWLMISFFLWFKAESLSKYFQVDKSNSEIKKESENFSQFLQIAIIVLGIYFIFKSVPQLFTEFIQISVLKEYLNEYQVNMKLINLFQPGITFILGMLCLSFNKVLVLFFNKIKGM